MKNCAFRLGQRCTVQFGACGDRGFVHGKSKFLADELFGQLVKMHIGSVQLFALPLLQRFLSC